MKKIQFIFSGKLTALTFLVTLVSIAIFSSCKEDDTGLPKFSTGTPSITRVYVLDTVKRHKDSSIVAAEPYTLLVINGENIGGIKSVFFNGYSATINPNYSTDNNLIITIPGEVPSDSTVDNKIRIVTSHGEATFNFKIIAKANVYGSDKITFGIDRGDVTVGGKNFSDVSSVVFSNTTIPIKIVAKTKDKLGNETMILRFPTTTIGSSTLDITNSSGIVTTKNLVFINADVAYKLFTEELGKNVQNGSWGDPLIVNSDQVFAGKKAISKSYAIGSYHLAAFEINDKVSYVPYSTDYKYLTFSIKGGSVPMSFWITTNATKDAGGYANYPDKNKIDVPARDWTYYRLALSDLDFWYPGTSFEKICWRVQGTAKVENIFFDDVMLVK